MELVEEVFESVTWDNSHLFHEVLFCVRESRRLDKVTEKIALTVGYRPNAQIAGLFEESAVINIGDGLFELREALPTRLFAQSGGQHLVRSQSSLKGRSQDVNVLEAFHRPERLIKLRFSEIQDS